MVRSASSRVSNHEATGNDSSEPENALAVLTARYVAAVLAGRRQRGNDSVPENTLQQMWH
jgi:hypothetical protein